MKKLSLIIAICIMGLSVFAQDTTKHYRNEFGIDVTGFLKQYLNFGNSQQYPTVYTPTYYLTYRRHFSGFNFRLAIGGDFTNNQVPSGYSNDSIMNYSRGYSLYASLGWEFYSNLSKKWQVYYGADLRTSLVYSNSDANNDMGPSYEIGSISKTQTITFAPLLGIRFKITRRLSILTEASYGINWEKIFNGTFYVLLPGGTGPLPPTSSQQYSQMFSSFSQPLSVFIDFRL